LTESDGTPFYNEIQLAQIEEEVQKSQAKLLQSLTSMSFLPVKQKKSQTFAKHGAARRLNLMWRAVDKIFAIYPPRRLDLLNVLELHEIAINLQAFFINAVGVLDNLAWIIVCEKGIEQNIRQTEIGLYQEKFGKHLRPEFLGYLQTRLDWHNGHLKDYRDGLAHQIPPYIPPYFDLFSPIDDSFTGRVASPVYTRSPDLNKDNMMKMHPQLIVDSITVVEVVSKFIEFEFPGHNVSISTMHPSELHVNNSPGTPGIN
jgi:hypothetical protein